MLAGILATIESGILINDPNLYSLEEWASSLPEQFNDIPRFVHEDNWILWADALYSSRLGLQYAIPSPVGFDNWKDWAIRVYQVFM